MSDKELRAYLPFITVKDGIVLSKRGDLTFGWKVWLPVAFTVNEAGYDSIVSSFLQAYKLLPPWCIVHKQDVFRYDVFKASKGKFFLTECYDRHFEGRRFLNGYSYIYLTFSSKQNVERGNGDSGFFGISDRKALSSERIQQCASVASQFGAVLKSNDLLALEDMSTDDFIRLGAGGRDEGVIADYLRFYDVDGPDYNFNFFKDRIEYGDNVLKMWYVEDSDSYPGEVSSVNFINEMSSGSSRVFLSGGSPIGFELKIPHVVNRYVLTLPRQTVEKELDQKKRLMTSFSNYSASCRVNAVELENYLTGAANEGTTTTKCFMDVQCWCHRDMIPDVRNSVVTAFSDLGVSCVEETNVVPLLHYAAIPGAEAELGYDNYINSEITAFLCHGLWDGYDFGESEGVVRVCDRRRMIPMRVDIQSLARAKGKINNMNALVVGPSGSGKSFTMNSLVQNFYEADEHIVIIDVGDSYEGLCAVVREASGGKDGVYNTYDPEHPFSFNPFKGRSHWDDLDQDGDKISSGRDFVFSLLQTIYKPGKGWTTEASSVLNNLLGTFFHWWDNGVPESVVNDLKDAYANDRRRRAERNHRRFDESKALDGYKDATVEIFRDGRPEDPIFDDFYQFVTRIVSPLMRDENFRMGEVVVTPAMLDVDAFGASMDMYKIGGQYGFLLNAREEADLFASRLTVFEVDKIKDNNELFPLWVLCIMHSFEDKMRALSCQKVLIIEEAWKAIATPTMANFIIWMWRTARKFRTSAVVVTQDINDLTGSEIVKGAIIQNTDVKILLDQRKNANNFENSVKTLGLTPMAKNLVLSVNQDLIPGYRYKEGFFGIGEGYSNVFAIEVSLEQALVFETDKTLKRPLFELAKEKGSFIEAVRERADQIRRKKD